MKEKIKEAYLEYWEQLSAEAQEMALNNFGWIFRRDSIKRNGSLDDCIKLENYLTYTRPKSLQGIEINNGWIKIESKDDLPKIDGHYWVVDKNETSTRIIRYTNDPYTNQMKNDWWMKYITHYQTIEVPSPPIY